MRASLLIWGRPVQTILMLFAVAIALVGLPGSSARAQNASPDTLWTLGNCNVDRRLDVADSIMMLNHLFGGGTGTPCIPLCDVTGDGQFNIADPISVLSFLFNGRSLPSTTPSREEKCDGIDNDCDGRQDENCPTEGVVAVDLAWDPVARDIEGDPEEPALYRLYIGTRTRQYTDVRNVGAVTGFRVYGLSEGVRYFFALTAVDRAGNESAYSNEIAAVPEPIAP